MVLGLYYITKAKRSLEDDPVKGEGLVFYSPEEVTIAYNEEKVDLHAVIKVRIPKKGVENGETEMIETTVGRVIFNQYVP
jgi:DNA-directed RNA polymerase subunit beta'